MSKPEILPYNAPCPKCARGGLALRWEPEITEEAYRKARLANLRCVSLGLPMAIIKSPQEEHLVRECECGYLFWTRTADYKPPSLTYTLTIFPPLSLTRCQ